MSHERERELERGGGEVGGQREGRGESQGREGERERERKGIINLLFLDTVHYNIATIAVMNVQVKVQRSRFYRQGSGEE